MNKGVPNCPDCGGKDMCDKHRLEYLKYCAETARNEYESEFKDQKTERNKNEKL